MASVRYRKGFGGPLLPVCLMLRRHAIGMPDCVWDQKQGEASTYIGSACDTVWGGYGMAGISLTLRGVLSVAARTTTTDTIYYTYHVCSHRLQTKHKSLRGHRSEEENKAAVHLSGGARGGCRTRVLVLRTWGKDARLRAVCGLSGRLGVQQYQCCSFKPRTYLLGAWAATFR